MTARMEVRLTPKELEMPPAEILDYLQNLVLLSSIGAGRSRSSVAALAAKKAGRPDNGDIRRELNFAEAGEKQASAARIAMALVEVLSDLEFRGLFELPGGTWAALTHTEAPGPLQEAGTPLAAILNVHTTLPGRPTQEGAVNP